MGDKKGEKRPGGFHEGDCKTKIESLLLARPHPGGENRQESKREKGGRSGAGKSAGGGGQGNPSVQKRAICQHRP